MENNKSNLYICILISIERVNALQKQTRVSIKRQREREKKRERNRKLRENVLFSPASQGFISHLYMQLKYICVYVNAYALNKRKEHRYAYVTDFASLISNLEIRA